MSDSIRTQSEIAISQIGRKVNRHERLATVAAKAGELENHSYHSEVAHGLTLARELLRGLDEVGDSWLLSGQLSRERQIEHAIERQLKLANEAGSDASRRQKLAVLDGLLAARCDVRYFVEIHEYRPKHLPTWTKPPTG